MNALCTLFTHHRPLASLASVALLASAAVACGSVHSEKTVDDPESVQSALESSNGGMTTTAESPSFGDPQFEAVPELGTAFVDTADPTAGLSAARRFHVALFWGHLPAPHDGDETDVTPMPMDWTGTVSVSAGAIGVKRTLLFDARDHLEPRSKPSEVAFVSHTLPHVDGLLLSVAVPAGASATLRFDTPSLKRDLDLGRLALDVGEVARLDDGRNGLFAIGYEDRPGCAQGFVHGRYLKLRPALGVFRGRVVDGDGHPIGHMRGIWGHAPKRDVDVFFGKYIGMDGGFRGLFGGTYGEGRMQGIWGTVDPKNAGGLRGFYSDGYDRGDGRGFFIGRWSERCGG